MSTVTMQELELEHAELLPVRETLWVTHAQTQPSSSTIISQSGQGNMQQTGNYGSSLSFLNGNLSGNEVVVGL